MDRLRLALFKLEFRLIVAVSHSTNDLGANTLGVVLPAILLDFVRVLCPFKIIIFEFPELLFKDGCRLIFRTGSGYCEFKKKYY